MCGGSGGSKGRGGGGGSPAPFDEMAHAKGVLAARDLAGAGAGPSQSQVNSARKTLQKAGMMPTAYEIKGNDRNPISKIYSTKKPVVGDTFKQGSSTAEVTKIYKTALGKTAIDVNVVGKKRGRISTVYLDT